MGEVMRIDAITTDLTNVLAKGAQKFATKDWKWRLFIDCGQIMRHTFDLFNELLLWITVLTEEETDLGRALHSEAVFQNIQTIVDYVLFCPGVGLASRSSFKNFTFLV